MRATKLGFAVAVLASVVALSSGCTVLKLSGAGARPIMLNNPQEGRPFDIVQHFHVEQTKKFDYTHSIDVGAMIAQVIAQTQADAIANLHLEVKVTAGDACLNGCTLGFAQAQTYVIEGDAIRYRTTGAQPTPTPGNLGY